MNVDTRFSTGLTESDHVYFVGGYPPETGYRWLSKRQTIVVKHREGLDNPSRVCIGITSPKIPTGLETNRAFISLNGQQVATLEFDSPFQTRYALVTLPPYRGRVFNFVIEAEHTFCPARLGTGGDERELSLTLTTFRLMTEQQLYDEIESQIVWVFAAPRSGSTWLASQLLANEHRNRLIDEPGIGMMLGARSSDVALGERYSVIDVPPIHPPLRLQEIHRVDVDVLAAIPEAEFQKIGLNKSDFLGKKEDVEKRVDGLGVKQNKTPHNVLVFDRLAVYLYNVASFFMNRKHAAPAYHNLRSLIFRQILDEFGYGSYERVVIKCASDSMAADIFREMFPKSRIIHLIRDPRDVISSRKRYFKWGGVRSHNKRKFLVEQCNRWRIVNKIIEMAYNSHPSDLRIRISYESLRQDTFGELKRLYKFMGTYRDDDAIRRIIEEADISKVRHGKRTYRKTGAVGAYQKGLGKLHAINIERYLSSDLERFGYRSYFSPLVKRLLRWR